MLTMSSAVALPAHLLSLPPQSLSIREHITVPASVTQPVIKCEVSFMADSGELAHQVVTIHTGVGGGKQNTFECGPPPLEAADVVCAHPSTLAMLAAKQ